MIRLIFTAHATIPDSDPHRLGLATRGPPPQRARGRPCGKHALRSAAIAAAAQSRRVSVRPVWRLTILLIGCGRVGFDTAPSDAVPGDSPAGDAAMVSLADHMSCGQPVLLDAGNHLAHDTLVWAATPLGECRATS